MNRTLGENITEARLRMYLTREDLAKALKVSPQLILDWEENKLCPDMFHIPELCEALGCEIKELFSSEENSEIYYAEAFDPEKVFIKIKASPDDKVSVNLPLEVIRNFLATGDICASAALNNSEALKYIPWDRVLEVADAQLLGIYKRGSGFSGNIVLEAVTEDQI